MRPGPAEPCKPRPAGRLRRSLPRRGSLTGPRIRSGSGPPPGRHHRPTTSTHTPTRPASTTTDSAPSQGHRVQIARYETDTGTRILVGQRIDRTVHLFDEPTTTGPTFQVEAGLESKAALDALVADYLATAKRIGYAPMHGWF